jgi:hypothetical protein
VRKVLRIIAVVAAGILVIAAVLLIGVYRASQHVPTFYQKALQREPVRQAKAGDQLERQVLELHNEVKEEGHWQAIFTDEQINGWLAADLPEKFPKALPKEVTDPRVAIEPREVKIACRYKAEKMSAILSLALEIHLTDEPNVVAVRIRKARAGALPLPLKQWLDRISKSAEKANVSLHWAQVDGDPVALVTVPREHKEFQHRILAVETIEMRTGEIYLAGRTDADETTILAASYQQAAADQSPDKKKTQR